MTLSSPSLYSTRCLRLPLFISCSRHGISYLPRILGSFYWRLVLRSKDWDSHWGWWCLSKSHLLRRQRQENNEFKSNLGKLVKICLKSKKEEEKKKHKRTGDTNQVVEVLRSKYEALGAVVNITHTHTQIQRWSVVLGWTSLSSEWRELKNMYKFPVHTETMCIFISHSPYWNQWVHTSASRSIQHHRPPLLPVPLSILDTLLSNSRRPGSLYS
jgi:hypothetical protein